MRKKQINLTEDEAAYGYLDKIVAANEAMKNDEFRQTLQELRDLRAFFETIGPCPDIREFTKAVCEDVLMRREMLSAPETAKYIQTTISSLYQLTYKKEIPYYRPNGKAIFFSRKDLDAWIRRHPVLSEENLRTEAEGELERLDAENEEKRAKAIKRRPRL